MHHRGRPPCVMLAEDSCRAELHLIGPAADAARHAESRHDKGGISVPVITSRCSSRARVQQNSTPPPLARSISHAGGAGSLAPFPGGIASWARLFRPLTALPCDMGRGGAPKGPTIARRSDHAPLAQPGRLPDRGAGAMSFCKACRCVHCDWRGPRCPWRPAGLGWQA